MHFLPPEWHPELASTNITLRSRLAANPALPRGTVIAAHAQTDGRGRSGTRWMTIPGKDLAFSCLLRPKVDLAWIPSLPMALALGIAHWLADLDIPARLKWPNDVLVEGRKISGVMVEVVAASADSPTLIVGVGVNLNMHEREAALLDQPATSVAMLTKCEIAPTLALECILPHLARWTGRWEEGGFSAIRANWISATLGLGQPAVIEQPTRRIEGKIADFGEHGELLLHLPDGKEHMVWSGHLHLSPEPAV